MNIEQILKNAGLEESLVSSVAETIKSEIPKSFVKKEQYNKKVNAIDSLQEKINELEARGSAPNEWEQKYKDIEEQLNQYKQKEEVRNKANIVDGVLKEKGFNQDKIRKLIIKSLDLKTIEVNDGKINDEVASRIAEEYKEFIPVTTVVGSEPASPVTGGNVESKPRTLAEALAYNKKK